MSIRHFRFAHRPLIAVIFLLAISGRLVLTAQVASGQPGNTATSANTPAGPSEPAGIAKNNETSPDSSLRLGPSDLLEVGVYNVPELSTKTRVSSNGDAYLPLVDYVHVAGLTVEEAQGVIEKRLSDGGFVKDPHVTILVDQFASQGISLLGEIAHPAVYPALGEQRLFDVISAAGGLTDRAGRSLTITHRNQPDKPVVIELSRNLSDKPESNVEIFPGDTIVVRRAEIVYVVGDVVRPSGLLMDRGSLTVLQAVALAGGTTSTSKLNSVKIIRTDGGSRSEQSVELKKILEAKIPDVPLMADDILFIPSSARRIVGRRGMDAAIQMATTVGIYSVRP